MNTDTIQVLGGMTAGCAAVVATLRFIIGADIRREHVALLEKINGTYMRTETYKPRLERLEHQIDKENERGS